MDKQERTVSVFEHENSLMHYGMVNRRSMVMLISVCITFILLTLIFVIGYTVREQHWLDALTRLTPVEVTSGVQQQSNP